MVSTIFGHTPQYKAPPMPPVTPPCTSIKLSRIKTVFRNWKESAEFDQEVNEALAKGWQLKQLDTTCEDGWVMLLAILEQYE